MLSSITMLSSIRTVCLYLWCMKLQGDDVKMRLEANNMQFVSGMFRACAHLVKVV